ncbi:hypothetical protein SBA5_680024 [Candidatus Sulfotelmatomonas gaucii]|uniref:Uncharacterized protein n=1 Tax=Candidatus Sulfuritelmatomonas gaucii TaxID=2043161 RepID=A0A2N9LZK5_9BACT|nr:hypothetical protein SBA5_680024 [Candidatus Sulfotelmatomonas gaucii]
MQQKFALLVRRSLRLDVRVKKDYRTIRSKIIFPALCQTVDIESLRAWPIHVLPNKRAGIPPGSLPAFRGAVWGM